MIRNIYVFDNCVIYLSENVSIPNQIETACITWSFYYIVVFQINRVR